MSWGVLGQLPRTLSFLISKRGMVILHPHVGMLGMGSVWDVPGLGSCSRNGACYIQLLFLLIQETITWPGCGGPCPSGVGGGKVVNRKSVVRESLLGVTKGP